MAIPIDELAPSEDDYLSVEEESRSVDPATEDGYRIAFIDWLGCASGGWDHPGVVAARKLGDGLVERVVALGAAGHVLDYDDTYLPGVAHLSAPTAPVALVLGSTLDLPIERVIEAYAEGFNAMARFSSASGRSLYDGGWHPTAVCGVLGAAVAAGQLLDLDGEGERVAIALSLLRASGLQAAFGSDGKSLQVGMAAAEGLIAAKLAAGGASTPLRRVTVGAKGFEGAFRARFDDGPSGSAVDANWLKPWPCCLQTMAAIELASLARERGLPPDSRIKVVVPPFARQAASFDRVSSGLEAKFSIPYLTAFTLLYGPPRVDSFDRVEQEADRLAAARVEVQTDADLGRSEAALIVDGNEVERLIAPLGSPARPMSRERFWSKFSDLLGDRAEEVVHLVEQPQRPARDLLAAITPNAHGHPR